MGNRYLKIIIHIICWGVFLILPQFIFGGIELWINRAPIHYISASLLLIGFYYYNYHFLATKYLSQKKIIQYSGIILTVAILYLYLPELLNSLFDREELSLNKRIQQRGYLNRNISSLVLFLIVFIISTGINVITELFETRQKKLMAESEKTKAELAFLKSQVNPHFLFNTLYSIYYLTLNKSDDAPEAVMKLSDIMRFVFTETQNDFVSLHKEIEYIEKYIDLQKLRISDKTQVNYSLQGDITHSQVAPLILIPFVENAFKYGVSSHICTTIDLTISIIENKLNFVLINKKIESDFVAESSQIGVENVKQRLHLIYPHKHHLNIKDDDGFYSVNLSIELS
ncbi:MAG: sensor histidine kinase [Bacteroidales bacterium]|nr:sensor histidine kinase [Bacteroidales bacterium]